MNDEVYKAGDVICSDVMTAMILEKLVEHGQNQDRELAGLQSDNAALREGLKKLQYKLAETPCDFGNHPSIGDLLPHLKICRECHRYQCVGCSPDCGLAKLLEGK